MEVNALHAQSPESNMPRVRSGVYLGSCTPQKEIFI